MTTKNLLATSMVLVLIWLGGSVASAGPYEWAVTSGEFTNTTSWNTGVVPGGGDAATFWGGCCYGATPAGTINVTLAQNWTNAGLNAGSENVIFNLQGNTYSVTNLSAGGYGYWNLFGAHLPPTLTISNGTVAVQRLLAMGGGATSTVSVVNGGKLDILTPYNDEVNVGNGYLSTLNILNGGQVEQANAARLFVGYNGAGTVNVSGQGSVFSNKYVYLGWDHPEGVLNVLDGGQFINTGPYLFNEGGGLITVSGAGSLLKQTGGGSLFAFGLYGNNPGGRMLVQSNANVVTEGGFYVGAAANTSGRITVDNATMTNLNNIALGSSGTGTMIVTNGGKVYSQWSGNAYDSDIGQFAGSTGTVQVAGTGSRWDNTHNVIVGGYNNYSDNSGGGAGYDGGVGTLQVGTGAVVTALNTISIRNRGTLDLDGGTVSTPKLTLAAGGVLKGSGTINATVTNAGSLSPGHSVGAITVSSNLVLTSTSAATFEFNSASSFDQVGVGQSFTAGGILNLQFNYAADTNNFTFFKIFDVGAGTGGGSFSQINWLGTPPQGGYRAGFIGNDFVITAIPEPGIAGLALVGGLAILAVRRRFGQ